jgi:hypothetical protein
MSSRPALAAVAWMVSSSVELQLVALAREAAQPAQRHLDVARAELLGVVVVLEGALVPDLHRAAVLACAADADALRVVAAVAERAGAAGADPLAAALVALLLLLQALLERLHQLVPAHLLDLGLLLRAELELQHLAQPVERDVAGEVGEHLHALEVGGKGAVELVEVGLVLDQRGARQVVELVHRRAAFVVDHAGAQRFEQGQVFLDRHRQFGRAQGEEEVDEHGRRSGGWTAIGAGEPKVCAKPTIGCRRRAQVGRYDVEMQRRPADSPGGSCRCTCPPTYHLDS